MPEPAEFALTDPYLDRTVSIAGMTFVFKAVAEDTAGAYMLMERLVAPQCGPPPHRHAQIDESLYILEGEFSVSLGDRTLRGTPGAHIHVPRGTVHAFQNISAGTGRMLSLFLPAGIERYFQEAGYLVGDPSAPPIPVSAEDVQRLIALGPKYGIEFSGDGHGSI
jgi:quercetin dioxygenase-like cupin family protein